MQDIYKRLPTWARSDTALVVAVGAVSFPMGFMVGLFDFHGSIWWALGVGVAVGVMGAVLQCSITRWRMKRDDPKLYRLGKVAWSLARDCYRLDPRANRDVGRNVALSVRRTVPQRRVWAVTRFAVSDLARFDDSGDDEKVRGDCFVMQSGLLGVRIFEYRAWANYAGRAADGRPLMTLDVPGFQGNKRRTLSEDKAAYRAVVLEDSARLEEVMEQMRWFLTVTDSD